MVHRFVNWFFFTVVMGAVPYLVTVAIAQLESDAPGRVFPPSPDILFLSLSACASVLSQLSARPGSVRYTRGSRVWASLPQWGLGIGLAASCMLYGAYVLKIVENPGRRSGVECTALLQPVAIPSREENTLQAAMRERWGSDCAGWLRTQDRYFTTAALLSLIFTGFATIVVCTVPQRR